MASMGFIKEKYQQFRRWQQLPFEYHDTDNHHCCSNCGNEYVNNYCPRCGQKAVYGPITWRSVWQGILDVWGMGTRSLLYTLWQLLWRPGYLMRDYISGKRQVCFPPVKMLVIVGVVVLLIDNWLYPDTNVVTDSVSPAGLKHYYDVIANWVESHYEWSVLLAFSFIIIPVWILFREAPAHPRHSLPQGFFIQVFTSTQFLLLGALILEPLNFFVTLFDNDNDFASFVFLVALPCILLVDYKQLFGYGWWSTLWRVLMTVPFGVMLYRVFLRLIQAIDCLIVPGQDAADFWGHLMIVVDVAVLIWLLAEIFRVINRKAWRGAGWWQALKRPLMVAVLSLVTGGICYLMRVDGAIAGLVSSYLNLIGG